MKRRRIKISFKQINKGNITPIDSKELSDANDRIREEMKVFIRRYNKNEVKSQQDAASLILNA